MVSFEWDKHFETGLEDVDAQHHRLVDVINRFGELLTRAEGVAAADAYAVFDELTSYAQYHFREEEGLMAERQLDPRFLDRHLADHAGFLDEVGLMRTAITPDHPDAQPLLRFLIDWLAYHILGLDQSMARQIRAIEAGASPEDAYAAEQRMREGATEPLLRALHGLFQQVSERNRQLLDLNRTLERKVDERTEALSSVNRALELANQRLEEIAMTDALTGLPNRRHALSRLVRLWDESPPLACMMIDADGFKEINDAQGHDAGDIVLRQLARTLLHSVRTDDLVSRLGGDEFLIVCPRTTLGGALHVAELVRKAVAELRVPVGTGAAWKGSISVGVAVRTAAMHAPDEMIKVADEAVYVAKRNGRNRVATVP